MDTVISFIESNKERYLGELTEFLSIPSVSTSKELAPEVRRCEEWLSAARALGMTHVQLMRRVILPQAVTRMIPAFLERAIELMKTTTLVATVSYADLLFQASDVAQKTFRPLEVFTAAAAAYFVILFAASRLVQAGERRLARSGASTAH